MRLYGRYASREQAEAAKAWQLAGPAVSLEWLIEREGDWWLLYFTPKVTA